MSRKYLNEYRTWPEIWALAIAVTFTVGALAQAQSRPASKTANQAVANQAPAKQVEKTRMRAADGAGAHGGVGIFIGKTLYLLDLVEAGVQKDPFFDTNIPIRPDFLEQVDRALANLKLTPKVRELVARKLSEVDHVSRPMALSLILGLKAYSWRMVDPQLMPTYDETSAIRRGDGDRVQLAARTSSTIMISRTDAAQLDDANLSALIFHELFFAFSKTTTRDPSCADRLGYGVDPATHCFAYQNSEAAQATTGFIFSAEVNSMGLEGLERMAANRIALPFSENGRPYESVPYQISTDGNSGRAFLLTKESNITVYGVGKQFSSKDLAMALPETEAQIVGFCASDYSRPESDYANVGLKTGQAYIGTVSYIDEDGPHVRLDGGVTESYKTWYSAESANPSPGVSSPAICHDKVVQSWAAMYKVAQSFTP